MPLLGSAAMLLAFDVAPEAISEHDDWHTHEHLPERLSIPGFLRGTRWVALRGEPRYAVLYEVAELATLTSPGYLERLNEPSAWTSKMMSHYRGMRRGFCRVTGSFGLGTGHVSVLVRFKPRPGSDAALRRWLLQDLLRPLPDQPGVGNSHLLEGGLTPQMTHEQRIRGSDANVDWAVLITGYREEVLADFLRDVIDPLEQQGGTDVLGSMYRIDYSLTRDEVVD